MSVIHRILNPDTGLLSMVFACVLGIGGGVSPINAQGFTDGHDDGSLTTGSVTWTAEGARIWSESGSDAQAADLQAGEGFLLNDYANTDDGVFEVLLRTEGNNPANTRHGGFVFRYTSGHYYHVALRALDTAGAAFGNGLFLLKNTTDFDAATQDVNRFTIANNLNLSGFDRYYPLKVEISGATFTFYLNDVQIGQFTDTLSPNLSGRVGYSYSAQWTRYVSVDWSRWTDAGHSPVPPVLVNVFPADSAIHVPAVRQPLRLQFDQDMRKGSGNVVIRNAADIVVESVDVLSDRVGVGAPALLHGFEAGVEEWTRDIGAVSHWSDERAYTGSHSLKVQSSEAQQSVEALYADEWNPVSGFQNWSAFDSVVVWIWSEAASSSATLFVRSGDIEQPAQTADSCALVPGTWNRCTFSVAQSLDASRIYGFGVRFGQSGTYYIDDAGLKKTGDSYVTVIPASDLLMDEVYRITADSTAFQSSDGLNFAGLPEGEWMFYTNRSPTDIVLSKSDIAEGSPVGSVVGLLSAVDADGSEPFLFRLISGPGSDDNNSFIIQGAQLRTAEVFRHNVRSLYFIRVQVQDGYQGVFEKELIVSVTDVNEAPSGLTLSNAEIMENAGVNAVVGYLNAQDADSGNAFTYALASGNGDTHNAHFHLSGNALRANADLDYETAPTLSVRIRATDQGGLWFEQAFIITVVNVNDNSPELDDLELDVSETTLPGTILSQLIARDADGDLNPLSYTLISGDADGFFALSSGGVLSLAAPLDHVRNAFHSLVVQVSDGLFTVRADIRITVIARSLDRVPGWNGEALDVILADTVRNMVRHESWRSGDSLSVYAQDRVRFLLVLDSAPSEDWTASCRAGSVVLNATVSAEGIRVDGFLNDQTADHLEIIWSAPGLISDTLRVPLVLAEHVAPVIASVRVHALYAGSGMALDLGNGRGMVVPSGADRLVFALTVRDLPGCNLQWRSLQPAAGLHGSWSGDVLTLSLERPDQQDSLVVVIHNNYGRADTLNLGWVYGASLGLGTETTGGGFRIVQVRSGQWSFQIPRAGRVEIQLIDARGVMLERQVHQLSAGVHELNRISQAAGQWYRIRWNGQSLVVPARHSEDEVPDQLGG